MHLFKRKNTNHSSYFSTEAWKYFVRFFKGNYSMLTATSIGATLQALLIIPVLLLVKYIFDEVIPQKDPKMLLVIGLAIILIRLISAGLTLYLRKINIRVITEAIFRLRENISQRIYTFSRAFYTQEDLRVLHTRIVQDTERISAMSSNLATNLIPSILISIGLCIILYVFNWYLFLIILCFFPVIFFSNRYLGKITKKKVSAYHKSFEGYSKTTLFIMKFMDLIKIQSTEDLERQRQIDTMEDLKEKTSFRTYFFSVNGQVNTFLVGISGILVIVIGGTAVINESMSLGEFFAFYIAANHLQNNINIINTSFTAVVTGNESLKTLHEIVLNKETEPYNGNNRIDFTGNIQLESVTFKYTDKPILNGLSLRIDQGSKVAVIGANGAGKSTIINLILGFYAPQSGNITADGIAFSELDFQHFRKFIGVVSQHPPLIPGTIRENIVYGNDKATEKDIISVSRLALASEFIDEFPQGYDTQIGEDGVLLSGGERQKVALARALLRKPRLLILDEPTNHLDHVAVRMIIQNLDHIEYRPAILLISHDMEVVKSAEQIFILEKGRLNPYVNHES